MRRPWQLFILVATLLALLPPARSSTLSFAPVSVTDVNKAIALNPPDNHARYLTLRKLLNLGGCRDESLKDLRVLRSAEPDLVCTLPGVSTPASGLDSRRLIVFARYDKVGPGSGLIDNWSGAVMLPLLFASVFPGFREHTIQFVATSGPEGLPVFLRSLKRQQRQSTLAILDLRDLGMETTRLALTGTASLEAEAAAGGGRRSHPATTSSAPNAAAPNLDDPRVFALHVAALQSHLGIPPEEKPYLQGFITAKPQAAKDESDILQDAGIPGVILHSVLKSNAVLPGSEADQPSLLNPVAYYASYYYLCIYLLVLDHPPSLQDYQRAGGK